MHRRLTLLAGAAFLAGGRALAQGGTPAHTTAQNRAEVVATPEFNRMAAMSDRFEIASSRLAEQKAQKAEVKQFARHMIEDHEKTSQELQVLMPQAQGRGAGAGTAYPQGREPAAAVQGGPQSDKLDQPHEALIQQLQQASGAEFDRLYARQQVTAHQQAVDMFRNYSQSGDNAQLKQWAAKTLPKLQEHLQLAQKLQQTVQG